MQVTYCYLLRSLQATRVLCPVMERAMIALMSAAAIYRDDTLDMESLM
jgi:hypothetical protein